MIRTWINKAERKYVHEITPVIIVFCFLVYVLLVGIAPAYAEEKHKWTFIGFTKYRDALYLYIDKDSISSPSHGVVSTWSKIAPSEKSKFFQQIKRELRKSNKSARGFHYTEILSEIDCIKNRIRHMRIVYIKKDGLTIHNSYNTDPEWKTIYVGSLWQNLQSAVCKH